MTNKEVNKLLSYNDSSGIKWSMETNVPSNSTQNETAADSPTVDYWQKAVEDMEREKMIREKTGLTVNDRFKIGRKIGSGSYGSLYMAHDLLHGDKVAVKFAREGGSATLNREYELYCALEGEIGIPNVRWFGNELNHDILVMQLLGPSVSQLFDYCRRIFNAKTVSHIGLQVLERLETMHAKGYVHRDLKPENILTGIGEREKLCYLIDLGIAARYRYRNESNEIEHISFESTSKSTSCRVVGTAQYASINNHRGMPLSRRDDLESLGYVLAELLLQRLPWSHKIPDNQAKRKKKQLTKEKIFKQMCRAKESINWHAVCPVMAPWIEYCQTLDFTEEPDYLFLRNILINLPSSRDIPVLTSQIREPVSFWNVQRDSFQQDNSEKKESDDESELSWIQLRESSEKEMDTFLCLYGAEDKGLTEQSPSFKRSSDELATLFNMVSP